MPCKNKFLKDIFSTYPDIASQIKSDSAKRYSKMIRDPLYHQIDKDIDVMNKK